VLIHILGHMDFPRFTKINHAICIFMITFSYLALTNWIQKVWGKIWITKKTDTDTLSQVNKHCKPFQLFLVKSAHKILTCMAKSEWVLLYVRIFLTPWFNMENKELRALNLVKSITWSKSWAYSRHLITIPSEEKYGCKIAAQSFWVWK
jgi:hypothetical protein